MRVCLSLNRKLLNYFIQGHTNPPICLCCNKNTDHFFSISSDRYLFKWNNTTRSVDWGIKSSVYLYFKNKNKILIFYFSN
jgi:hypothetical protein